MTRSQLTHFFPSGNANASGAISYIVSKSQTYPSFSHNEELAVDYGFHPRQSYSSQNNSYAYDSIPPNYPYIFIDLGPLYSITPISYSISIKQDYTPPTEWTVTASNVGDISQENEWITISHKTKQRDFCINMPSASSYRCGETTYGEFFSDISLQQMKHYRYFKYTVIRSRNDEQDYVLLRMIRFEIYGILHNSNFCQVSKLSCFNIRSFLFLTTSLILNFLSN